MDKIQLFGRSEKGPPQQVNVISPARGGPYSTQTMLTALRKNVQKKLSLYTRSQFPSGGAYLLIHYDQAWIYCSPIMDPSTNLSHTPTKPRDGSRLMQVLLIMHFFI